jgi:sugar lactone lactonase YvrE
MNVDGSDRKTIVADCHLPDGIVVDAEAGHIYWTNMGVPNLDDGSIERADLDGGNRRVIVPQGITHTPKQIHLDKRAGKLYWCDREGMRVMRADLDGSHVETLVETGRGDKDVRDQTRWCVGITIDPKLGKIYWTQKGPTKGDWVASGAPTSTLPTARAQRTAPTSRCCLIGCRNPSTSSSI